MRTLLGLAAALAAGAGAAAAPAALSPVRDRPVPILMYHVLASPPPAAPYPGLYVSPAEFAAELRWLARHGYRGVTLGRVFGAWHGRGTLPARPVVLTFDDGYRSDYAVARPLLAERRWPGVLDLLVANLRPAWGLRPGLVRRLARAGWEIDSHSLTHPDLTRVGAGEDWLQIEGSRVALRREFHVPVDFFCYPSGRFDAAVVADVRRAGYEGATTEVTGLARPTGDPYVLARIRVSGGEGAAGLAASFASLGLAH